MAVDPEAGGAQISPELNVIAAAFPAAFFKVIVIGRMRRRLESRKMKGQIVIDYLGIE